jgi:demethylmenaquinone methyltransferase/2-methoxy-6-polyprenyl-1,4-benzoquinol methylase
MFGAVAPRYDLLNHLLSFNIDRRWRRKAVDRLLAAGRADGLYVDACAGTLDLTVELATRPGFRGQVIAGDFALPMLAQGASKVHGLPVGIVCADAMQLPLRDNAADGAMVAFGVRNLSSIDVGLAEFARIMKPGAPLIILEFTTPAWQPFRALYRLYFYGILPRIGRMLSRHDSAYDYLPASVDAFPAPAALAERMRAAGFAGVDWDVLTGGIAAVHYGVRLG